MAGVQVLFLFLRCKTSFFALATEAFVASLTQGAGIRAGPGWVEPGGDNRCGSRRNKC